MNVFSCSIEKCGRKFTKKEELKDHCTRRHSGHSSSILLNPTKTSLDQLHSETTLNLKANKIIMSELVKSNIKRSILMPKKKAPTPLFKPQNIEKISDISKKNENLEEKNINNIGNSLLEEKSHENTTGYSMSFNKDINENFLGNGNLVDLNQEKAFEDLMRDDDDSEIEMIESPEKNEKVEYEQILSSKQKLTEDFLIKKSGIFERMEHITTVKNLFSFINVVNHL